MNSTKITTKLDSTTKHLIEWPKHLRTPAELLQSLSQRTKSKIIRSPQCTRIILQIVGSWAYFVANISNRTRIFNLETFDRELKRIEAQNADEAQPTKLLNPIAIEHPDDPVLWGALLPFSYYSSNTDSVRWAPAAVDICFSKPWHAAFFAMGKTFPIARGVGLNQPAMDFALALLRHNQWLHLFPEGKVMRDKNQQIISNLDRGYLLKWGISKLILDYFKLSSNVGAMNHSSSQRAIRILPFYHLGLDEVLPIGWPYIPRINKRITILLRQSVIEMNSKLLDQILRSRKTLFLGQQMKSRTNDEIKRIKLTKYLEEELDRLIEPATTIHSDNKR